MRHKRIVCLAVLGGLIGSVLGAIPPAIRFRHEMTQTQQHIDDLTASVQNTRRQIELFRAAQ
jgi:hypothetical protein